MKPCLLVLVGTFFGYAFVGLTLFWPSLQGYVKDVCVQKFDEHMAQARQAPLIFIGGVPRSGTTLMRVMLDAHADVRCGEETFIITKVLRMVADARNMPYARTLLEHAGVKQKVFDSAIASFILNIIRGHGKDAKRLCNKDPLSMSYSSYLAKMFPNAKFVLMLRDGRAVAHSIIKSNILELTGLRNATTAVKNMTTKWREIVNDVIGVDLRDYGKALKMWDRLVADMLKQCCALGEKRCFPMRYESLVLNAEEEMDRLLEFLELPWDDKVLHHEQLIGDQVVISEIHPSSKQVKHAISSNSLYAWSGQLPPDVEANAEKIAPMLQYLASEPETSPEERLTNLRSSDVCESLKHNRAR